MAIPLVASGPPPKKYTDLITGDSSTFAASVGGWTNSGGTQSRDTTLAYRFSQDMGSAPLAASLKLVTTATGQYTEVAIPGVFKAGVRYDALLIFTLEETPAQVSTEVRFGLIGTDAQATQSTSALTATRPPANGNWHGAVVSWVPTADRTGVKLRFSRLGAEVGTQTWHIGWARAARVETGLGLHATPPPNPTGGDHQVVTGPQTGYTMTNPNHSIGLQFGKQYIDIWAEEFAAYLSLGQSVYLNSEHTPGDFSVDGVEIDVGDDYVGLQIGEKDSSTVQVAPLNDQDGEFADQGIGHWHARTNDGVQSRIGGWFEQVFRVAGTLTAATDVAPYWQAPYNMRIDEVRCHAGTAPTGQAILVDVNDDGTTVFTTQGNRPSIAASGNDATSGAADGGTSIAKDSVITIDVDQVGSGTAGADLFVSIRGRYIW